MGVFILSTESCGLLVKRRNFEADVWGLFSASFGLPLWPAPVPTLHANQVGYCVWKNGSRFRGRDHQAPSVCEDDAEVISFDGGHPGESWVWRSTLRTMTQEASGATSGVTIRLVEQMPPFYNLDILLINQTWFCTSIYVFEDFKILSLKLRCFAVLSLHENDGWMHERLKSSVWQTANPDHQFAQQTQFMRSKILLHKYVYQTDLNWPGI